MKVRCIDDGGADGSIKAGNVYTLRGFYSSDGCTYVNLAEVGSGWGAQRFEPYENRYSIPAACQQEPDGCACYYSVHYCDFCIKRIEAVRGLIRAVAPWELPKDNCLPSTAKAILDLDRPKLTPVQQQQGEGVQRALDRLNSGDHRYGFNEYQP